MFKIWRRFSIKLQISVNLSQFYFLLRVNRGIYVLGHGGFLLANFLNWFKTVQFVWATFCCCYLSSSQDRQGIVQEITLLWDIAWNFLFCFHCILIIALRIPLRPDMRLSLTAKLHHNLLSKVVNKHLRLQHVSLLKPDLWLSECLAGDSQQFRSQTPNVD